ncbi:MAG: GIY-YIG nuclease family protein [Acidobacteriota bacterium]
MKADPGAYALMLRCRKEARVRVGGLGWMHLRRGFYVYLGSALGPGGVRARVARHLRPPARPHWHIDYLRANAAVEGVWCCYDCRLRRLRLPLPVAPVLFR